jgi:YVTN family beta-propeller protein
LLVWAAGSAGVLGSAQSLAQNAYITNEGSDTVSVIDTKNNTVTATIPVGGEPIGVAASPNGRRAYIANVGATVSVINTATNKVVDTIDLTAFASLYGVAVSPDSRKVCVANPGSGSVLVIDAATDKVIARTLVAHEPFGVAVAPDGKRVYVTEGVSPTDAGVVSVIDATTYALITTIPVGIFPFGVAVTPDGSKVYVANESGGLPSASSVSVIDTAKNTVIATIPVSNINNINPFGVAIAPDGRKVYVTDGVGVSVISTAKNEVTATIPVSGPVLGVAVTPDGRKVYVASAGFNNVAVIDTAKNTVTTTVPVGSSPFAFGVFIQPAPRFAGAPGKANCYGQSFAALANRYSGLNNAAAALGFDSINALQASIEEFCAA